MKVNKNSNALYIEDCILSITLNDNVNSNLENIKRYCTRLTGANTECKSVKIINNDSKNLSGMSIYPAPEYISSIYYDIVEKKNITVRTYDYNIEIDSKILTDKSLNMKPSEITAILLHELGHIIIDTTFIRELTASFTERLYKNGVNIYNDDTERYGRLINELYVYNFIDKTKSVTKVKNYEMEVNADDFAIKMGYAEDLKSALNKFASYYNTTLKKMKSNKQIIIEYDREADMYIDLIKSFKFRADTVNKAILMDRGLTHSIFLKERLKEISDSLMHMFSDIRRNKKQKLNESSILGFFGKKLNISQKNIDELKVEVEMIDCLDDKLVMIRKIHKSLDNIDSNIKDKKVSKDDMNTLNNFKKQLEEILNNVITLKIQEKRYGVFVKYPKGYEG